MSKKEEGKQAPAKQAYFADEKWKAGAVLFCGGFFYVFVINFTKLLI